MGFEFINIRNIPDMVSYPIFLRIINIRFFIYRFLKIAYRLFHRYIRMAAASHIVGLADTGILIETPESIYQIISMNIISYLFTLISINVIFSA